MKPQSMFPSKSKIKLFHGDCLEVMQGLPDSSVDCVVTDPPYALTSGSGKGFMGKEWDGSIPGVEIWKECLRVAKPGAMLLAFGGTRTYHRLTCAIEDAGWEIRDCLMWVYGSGFPKSLNVGKAVDALQGNECEVVGEQKLEGTARRMKGGNYNNFEGEDTADIIKLTKGVSAFEGYGTALKPAYEPIVLAMKPLDGTFANNALKHGVAGLNIDECRVKHNEECKMMAKQTNKKSMTGDGKVGQGGRHVDVLELKPQGRFPANLILTYPEDEYTLKEDLTKEQKNEIFQWLQENA